MTRGRYGKVRGMIPLVTAALAFWAAALIARPRRPLPGNEVQELVYVRLLGRQQILTTIALGVTLLALLVGILALPQQDALALSCARWERGAAGAASHTSPPCDELSGGVPRSPYARSNRR